MQNNSLRKLKVPSTGLLVCGCLNGFLGFITLLSGVLRFSGLTGKEVLPTNEAERAGYLFATFGGYGIALVSLVVAPIVVFGAMRMGEGRSRGLAIASAILAILPLTSCCFFVSAVFGIWALVVLMQADVKAAFAGNLN